MAKNRDELRWMWPALLEEQKSTFEIKYSLDLGGKLGWAPLFQTSSITRGGDKRLLMTLINRRQLCKKRKSFQTGKTVSAPTCNRKSRQRGENRQKSDFPVFQGHPSASNLESYLSLHWGRKLCLQIYCQKKEDNYTVRTFSRLLEERFVQKWQKCSSNFAQKNKQEEQKNSWVSIF